MKVEVKEIETPARIEAQRTWLSAAVALQK
jgi:hypothetical protein